MQNTVQKTAMPMAAGILSIISGAGHIIGFIVLLTIGAVWSAMPNFRGYGYFEWPTAVFITLAIILLITGVIIIIGGVYTLRRRYWGWALAAAILAFLPFNLIGLAAIILVALSRREFDWVNVPIQPNPPPQPIPPGQPGQPSQPGQTTIETNKKE
jgi:hypothetical protein